MKRRLKWFIGGGLAVAMAATPAAPAGIAAVFGSTSLPEVCRDDGNPNGQQAKIATAKLIIEYNFTDNDLGVHGAFDDHGWSELCVFDPNGNPIAVVDPRKQLNHLTMAGIFFESREPPGSEFTMAELAAAFPEGRYTVRGKSFDGAILVGNALFTHDVPAPPTITSPQIASEPDQIATPVSRTNVVIGWDPVTQTVAGGSLEITGYEVIITKEVDDDRHGFSRPTFDVHVPGTQDSLSVPMDFLEPNTVYELEVLALERTGNQTISVGFFMTD